MKGKAQRGQQGYSQTFLRTFPLLATFFRHIQVTDKLSGTAYQRRKKIRFDLIVNVPHRYTLFIL
uniref:Uncharacterized protein n=1 Tax=Klebsiella pneumoniae TaxID=573 RepID=A0A486VZ91_KLEPN|nr:Uncharacterised protein [Klebsiella pneumoniae]